MAHTGEIMSERSTAGLNFMQLTDLSTWKSFDDFIVDVDSKLDEDIEKSLQYRREFADEVRKRPGLKERIRPRDSERDYWANKVEWAESQLYGGSVTGVDGTISRFQLASGTRCRIGVVATTYVNNRIEKVLFVSERQFAEPATNAVDHFKKLQKQKHVSQMVLRAVMGYSERDLLLSRKQEWKLLQGEYLPYELRTGLGLWEILDTTIELGKRLIEAKKVIAITEDTSWTNLNQLGYTLEKGQFMEAPNDMKWELTKYLEGDPETGLSGAHFNPTDEAKFREFIDGYADQIKMGIYRVGFKPYVFYAHKDHFDEAVAIVMADSQNQPMRGFPLLLDYADNLATGMLSQGDFEKQIMSRIAMIDPEELGFEMSARKTRSA